MARALRDPTSLSLRGESSNEREIVAACDIETGRYCDAEHPFAAPLISRMILPHAADEMTGARVQALGELAVVLRTVFGFISLEPTFSDASTASIGLPPLMADLQRPGMSERRIRERHGFREFPEHLDRQIPGPEWGLFLSGQHIAQLPAGVLQPGAVFVRVERLADDLVYAQLTDDPADALRADYDALLQPARDALAPILMDVSAIELE